MTESERATMAIKTEGLNGGGPSRAIRFGAAIVFALGGWGAAPALAQHGGESAAPMHEQKPHHLSILAAGTHIDAEDETDFTLGLDYEYRVSELIGLGFVAEQAFGEIDSTTLLAVADVHIVEGLVVQVGPGIEFIDDTEYAIARLGVLYEFELGNHFTISPQFHYDFSEGEDAIVFGLAFGRAF